MKVTRVMYTVQPEYVETNKANIRQVMSDLAALNNPDMKYAAYVGEDGRTFTHLVMFKDGETPNSLNGLPAFEKFRTELKAHGPEKPPASESLDFVGAGHDIF